MRKLEPYEKLYRAVAAYIEAQGGSLLIAEGVQVLRWPGDAANKFTLCVKCFGRAPETTSTGESSTVLRQEED